MPLVKVSNREGVALVAEIYQGSQLVGTTDAKGELEVPKGDYVAKVSGYDEKRFRVHHQATPTFVSMSTLAQVNPKSEVGFFKKLGQQDKFVLIAVSLVVVGFATFYTIRKRRNAKV